MSRARLVAEFAASLRRCREEAGFRVAGEFFRAHGAAFLGCGPRAYRNIEAGRALPSPRVMARLAAALRLALRGEAGRQASLAYLRALLADDEFLAFLRESASGKAPAGPARRAPEPSEGTLLFEHPLLLRASEAELRAYWPFVVSSLDRFARDASKGARARRYAAEVSLQPVLRF